LALLDLSLRLESLLIGTLAGNEAGNLESLLEQICHLSMASAASGYTETWEWNQIRGDLNPKDGGNITLEELNTIAQAARNQLNWGTSYNKAVFDEDVERFKQFEPMAAAFLDDRIRGSVALYLATSSENWVVL
jgi:hypothetical protein